jgi:hypothetical protein
VVKARSFQPGSAMRTVLQLSASAARAACETNIKAATQTPFASMRNIPVLLLSITFCPIGHFIVPLVNH